MNRKSVNRGRQLRFVRQYRGMSQQELCKSIIGLSQANLSKFENGFTGQLSDEMLERIMRYFDWPVDWLDRPSPSCDFEWD